MTNEPERIRTDVAAALLGVHIETFKVFARRRGWESERDPYDGRYVTFDRATIEKEAKARIARNARVTPADLKHAVRCAAIIRDYWKRRGYSVDVEAVGVEIVSDLVNGLPVRR
jgi:hypothetical protein